MHHSPNDPRSTAALVGIDEAATLVNLKRSTIYALTSRRLIPHYKKGGKLFFDREELIAWIRSGRREVIDSAAASRHLQSKNGRVQ